MACEPLDLGDRTRGSSGFTRMVPRKRPAPSGPSSQRATNQSLTAAQIRLFSR